jgi:nucleoid-associated protein YgaU
VSLARASIQPVRPWSDAIPFLFNPSQYTLDAANQLAEVGVPGQAMPVLQFVRGAGRTLSLELLFDTYETRELGGRPVSDVSALTDAIYKLLDPTPETGAPPICLFTWKDRRLQCVLERVSGRFTLFASDGAPLRATLAVTLRECADVQLAAAPQSLAGRAGGTRVVKQGDTLSGIAQDAYGDPTRWRALAAANRIANPRKLQPGQVLVIPSGGQ